MNKSSFSELQEEEKQSNSKIDLPEGRDTITRRRNSGEKCRRSDTITEIGAGTKKHLVLEMRRNSKFRQTNRWVSKSGSRLGNQTRARNYMNSRVKGSNSEDRLSELIGEIPEVEGTPIRQ
ncbi:hypothetical protein OXYTRIMIC_071 [Oxytricha trifallax]|uniref:Uncharacterized protein n=1 Tax=Oxytricha trifallax TaxID=1172189 RepID=A0A073HZE8_9SPIT|nr:hypothetical protein OXYTRIMIC_071 [Oxytricha trifallax]